MEPIKLTDEEVKKFNVLVEVMNLAKEADQHYRKVHQMFWTEIKEKYSLNGHHSINEDTMEVIEERRRDC